MKLFSKEEIWNTILETERSFLYDLLDENGEYNCYDDYRYEVFLTLDGIDVRSNYDDHPRSDICCIYETPPIRNVSLVIQEWIDDPCSSIAPWTIDDAVDEYLSGLDKEDILYEVSNRLDEEKKYDEELELY